MNEYHEGPEPSHSRCVTTRADDRMGAFATAILAILSILARVAPRLDASRLPPVSIDASPVTSVRTPVNMDDVERVLDACRTSCREVTFEPVCLDGSRTYSNECWARCAVEGGLIETVDGGAPGSASLVRGACARDREAFEIPLFACARACVMVYEPVCAENGQSVSNACIADCSGLRYVDGSCAV